MHYLANLSLILDPILFLPHAECVCVRLKSSSLRVCRAANEYSGRPWISAAAVNFFMYTQWLAPIQLNMAAVVKQHFNAASLDGQWRGP